MILFKVYLTAIVELAIFNPEILDVDYKKNWMSYPRTYYYDIGAKWCQDNKDVWQTKVYSWEVVGDGDFCVYEIHDNKAAFVMFK